MASRISLSHPLPNSDLVTATDNSNQKSPKTVPKFRIKFNPNRLSPAKDADSFVINGSEPSPSLTPSSQKSPKVSNDPSPAKLGDSFVSGRINGTDPIPVSDPSHKKSLKIKFRVKNNTTKILNYSSLVKEGDGDSLVAGKISASEPNPAFKAESFLVADTQQTQASIDQPAVININNVKKNKKKRRFSVTLSREEIEEDIAAIEALAGLKRLRRPKKRDQPYLNVDQRQLDRLFPGLGYC